MYVISNALMLCDVYWEWKKKDKIGCEISYMILDIYWNYANALVKKRFANSLYVIKMETGEKFTTFTIMASSTFHIDNNFNFVLKNSTGS